MRSFAHSFLLASVLASLCLVQAAPLQPSQSGSTNITFTPKSTLRTASTKSTLLKYGIPPLLSETNLKQQPIMLPDEPELQARNSSPQDVKVEIVTEIVYIGSPPKSTAAPTPITLPPLLGMTINTATKTTHMRAAAKTMAYLSVPLLPSTSIRPNPQAPYTTTTTLSKATSTATVTKTTPTDQPPIPEPTRVLNNNTCFPALDFVMPKTVPNSLDGWWCDQQDEYAFLGFSYDVSACQSQAQLNREFLDARKRFNSRYIRMYGACDQNGFYDRVIEAAWNAGLGVHSLIWFGFEGSDTIWRTRKQKLFDTLKNNPRAPYVTRSVQFGSEPIFDWAIDPRALATQMIAAKKELAPQRIPIISSDLAWAFQSRMNDGTQQVLDASDVVGLHMLPYFSQNATTGSQGWWNNMYDMQTILGFTKSTKKIIWTQNGWPSSHYCPGVCPNSKTAVSSVKSERSYYKTLDERCPELKKFPKGGVGWFAHIYSDSQQPGYGIYDYGGQLKWADFAPRTKC